MQNSSSIQNLTTLNIPYDQLAFLKNDNNELVLLGEGGFSKVYKGTYLGKDVAIKVLKKELQDYQAKEALRREIKALKYVSSARVVDFFGICIGDDTPYIVMEFLSGDSLHFLLRKESFKIEWSFRIQIASDVIEGLYHLHRKKILHRDIKSKNILISQDRRAKLIDFGLACKSNNISNDSTISIGDNNSLDTAGDCGPVGTAPWMAPEVAVNSIYSDKSDIYAYGITLWEMASCAMPFAELNFIQISVKISNGERPNLIPILDECSYYKTIIEDSWQQDSSKRPTARKLKEIFSQYTNKEDKKKEKENLDTVIEIAFSDYFKPLCEYAKGAMYSNNMQLCQPLWLFREQQIELNKTLNIIREYSSHNEAPEILLLAKLITFIQQDITYNISRLLEDDKKELINLAEANFTDNLYQEYATSLLITLLLRGNEKDNFNNALNLLKEGSCTAKFSGREIKLIIIQHTDLLKAKYIEFSGAKFLNKIKGLDFSGQHMLGIIAAQCTFVKIKFRFTCLQNSNFKGATLNNVDAKGASLIAAKMSNLNAKRSYFQNCVLYKADLENISVKSCHFKGEDFKNANFDNINSIIKQVISEIAEFKKPPSKSQILKLIIKLEYYFKTKIWLEDLLELQKTLSSITPINEQIITFKNMVQIELSKLQCLYITAQESNIQMIKEHLASISNQLPSLKETVIEKQGIVSNTLEGHTDFVSCLAVMRDGSIVSGSDDTTLKIWDKEGKCLLDLKGHTESVSCVAVMPKGTIVSGSWDNTLKIWDKEGKCLLDLKGHTSSVLCVAVMQDSTIVSGSRDNTLKIWDKEGKCLHTLEGHTNWVSCVAVMQDGTIVSGSGDDTLKTWDKEGKCLLDLKGHTDTVTYIAVMQDGTIVSGSYDNTLKIWDKEGKCLHTLAGHTNSVSCVAVMQDGTIVSGSYDNTLKIWDKEGKCLHTLKGHTGTVLCVAVMPDGSIVSGSYDNTLKIWDSKLSLDFAGWQEISLIELDNLTLLFQLENKAANKSLIDFAKFLDKDNLINEEYFQFKNEESLKIFLLTLLGGEFKNNKINLNINLPNLQHLVIKNCKVIEEISGKFIGLKTFSVDTNIIVNHNLAASSKNLEYINTSASLPLLFNGHSSKQNTPLLKLAAGQSGKKTLESNAASFGFDCYDVAPNGLCLFLAVKHQLDKLAEIRSISSNSIEDLQEIFRQHMLGNRQAYQDVISDPEQFVDRVLNYQQNWHTEIGDLASLALSRALNINIVIISDVLDDNNKINLIVHKRSQPRATIFLGYETGIHYQSLIKNDLPAVNNILEVINAAEIDSWTPTQSEINRKDKLHI